MPTTLRACKALVLATAVLAVLAIDGCHAHGFLESPLSRARALGYQEWEAAGGNGIGSPRRYYSDGGFLNDQADVCGDPHQDVGDLNIRGKTSSIQATYSAGSVITIKHRITVNHGGWLGMRLCPSTRTNPTQECFAGNILTNADTGYQRWWITSGRYADAAGNVISTTFTTRWRLPAGVSCDGGCVLQMVYRTANSCIDPCSSAECGGAYSSRSNPVTGQTWLDACTSMASTMVGSGSTPRTEIFRDCADIRITPSSGGGGGDGGSCPSVSGYTSTASYDFNGNDIMQSGTSTSSATPACNLSPWCRGFNSNGWIKHTLANGGAQSTCFYKRNQQPIGPAHGVTVSIGTGTNRRGCVDVPWSNKVDGAALQQWECNRSGAQRWYLENSGNGRYYIKSSGTNLCLAVRNNAFTSSGTDIIITWCNGSTNQLWGFAWSSAGNGYTIRPVSAWSMCMDVQSSNPDNGARVHIWGCNDSRAQWFAMAP
ncbi:hypothetical protein HYH03_017858 [Edaphochlamys debaryana]|uniref:Ricin B lectin domain-containing protein n=1 Tax=Edaphochlamys debaryana TaxID=47281 RepID=A0A835XLM6_9CHLO|nr:hypothetical protein HYH03_017858 [Edaphochlamys debaryana]|eukprot:KAG2483260.1 hypothetical protein HYH03_017858 [Edaphochlamys debaryana]